MTGVLTDYLNRITSEHRNKSNFVASVAAATQPFVDLQAVANALVNVFDLDEAVGTQLDQVGLWLGITRILAIPLANVFFSWDTATLGWEQGVWQGPYDPTTGVASLDDNTYREVLRLKAAYTNMFNGTTAEINEILTNVFALNFSGLTINLIDNFNMSITYQLRNAGVPAIPLVQQLFLQGMLTVKPMSTAVNYVII